LIAALNTLRNFILTVGCVIVWSAVSVYLLLEGAAENFQRWGSVAVLATLTLITLVRAQRLRRFDRYEARIAEIALSVVGTMQWGYGDLFHCWFNGKGWSVC
jgi:Flp pilus assembly protein TadB